MTARDGQPDRERERRHGAGDGGAPLTRGGGGTIAPLLLPLALYTLVTTASFARRGWGRGDDARARAQAAKDTAAAAFYALDTAQRDLRISIEMITAMDRSPSARRALADFEELGRQIDEASQEYISAVDRHDLDRDDLAPQTAAQAGQELARATERLRRVKADLERFERGLSTLLRQAETQLAQLAPAVERARQALLAATEALDTVRAKGFRADELAARLAGLAPELTKLNEGAGQHGVEDTIRRAEEVQRTAGALRDAARRLPERAAEIDRRLVSLRTRAESITTRAGQVEPVLSELRRRFSVVCWQDLQEVPQQAASAVAQAEERLREARRARDEQRWPDVTALLSTVRSLLNTTDEAVSTAGNRLRRLNEVSFDRRSEVERARFALRDAQRLAMSGRSTPDPRHAQPLDQAVERLERAVTAVERGGRHPDYWHFLTELDAVRETAAEVVREIRDARADQR